MAKTTVLVLLKVLMIFIAAGWISLWLLKPTQLWTRKWKAAEESARATVFGSYGLNFAVYTFPVIGLAVLALVYLDFLPKESRNRQARRSTGLSNPAVVTNLVGVITCMEILAVFFFLLLLAWTFYAHISKDFKKLESVKSLKLNLWELKYMRVATRFGLLAEICLALLLLPILRGMALTQLFGIQFEASVRYHIWLGTAMIFFGTFHGASTLFIWGVSHHIQDEIWRWQKTGRIYLAGEVTLITGLVIWITSLPQIRRRRFELFYYTHHLYIIFLIFFLFHTGDRHFYMVFPGVFLYGLDKLQRIIQSRPQTCILSAQILPCKAIQLVLPKNRGLKYNPTSILFMKIPSISKFQWHSFSITSSCTADNDTVSVIIKSEGRWTTFLYDMMIQAELNSDADQMKCISVAIEGPYGPPSVDFLRHDSLLLIAGGVGVTPFLSILKEIASAQSNSRHKFPTSIQLIYVIKKSQDICLLTPILPLLLNQTAQKCHIKVKCFVTQEQKSGTTITELLNELPQSGAVNFSTELSNSAIHGPESFSRMAILVGFCSIVFLVVLICLNHIFVPSAKKTSKEKTSSSVTDILLLTSFIVAIACSSLVAILSRRRRLKKETPPMTQKQEKYIESSITKTNLEEHQVHFGGRPNFQDAFSEYDGSDVGVLVCGPVSMEESVATLCQLKSQGLNMGAKKNKPYFTFHSLSFTL